MSNSQSLAWDFGQSGLRRFLLWKRTDGFDLLGPRSRPQEKKSLDSEGSCSSRISEKTENEYLKIEVRGGETKTKSVKVGKCQISGGEPVSRRGEGMKFDNSIAVS